MGRSVKDIIGGTYFGKLFRTDKFIFWIISLFFSLSLLSNLIRLQTTPFFIWDMYSRRAVPVNTYHLLEVGYDDDTGRRVINIRHSWNEPEKTMLTRPLASWLAIRDNHSVDPSGTYLTSHWLKKHPGFASVTGQLYNTSTELNAFPGWYQRWLSAAVGHRVNKICVIEKKLQFEKDGELNEISSDTVLVIP